MPTGVTMETDMSRETKRAVGSLDRGLDVLEILSERGDLKLAEFPELLGTSRATAFRIISVLQDRGYVVHDRARHSYGLGAAALGLGSRSRSAALGQAAEPVLSGLRDTGETVNLAVFEGGRLVYIRIVDGTYPLRMSGVVGEEAPLHATALGTALLSRLPESEHAALVGPEPYHAFTDSTPTTAAELRDRVIRAGERGFAVDDQGVDVGAVCVGAAILDPTGAPLGGISLSGPAARLSIAKSEEFGEAIVESAAEIGRAFASLGPQ